MKLALALVLAFLSGPLTAVAAPRPSTAFDAKDILGIYVIGGYREPRVWLPTLTQNGIKGIALSTEWTALEPKTGQRDWSALDEDVRQVARAGRRVGLRLQAGISTPEWVYARGARRFTFEDRNPYHAEGGGGARRRNQTLGQTLTLPVPWDEAFLSAWEAFVAAAGAHYAQERAIAMVHVTGPNKHSAEMILPRLPDDREQWRSLGYTPNKLIGAWKRCIDAYARAFPQAALVLNLSPAIFDDEVVEQVVAYGVERYGKRLFLQNNILLGDNGSRQRVDWKILERYRDVTIIGFQRQLLRLNRQGVQGEEKTVLRRENFEKMFEEGQRRGARYFEIGADEARDFPDLVDRFARALAR